MGYYYYGFDPMYILILISCVIAGYAQIKVQSTYSRYAAVQADSRMTACDAARKILDMAGLQHIRIEHIRGNLTDHYDPRQQVLRLSDSVYSSASIAAIGVAAHECGHAIQHDEHYAPLVVRNSIVPVVNIASQLSWLFIAAGLIFSFNQTLVHVGIIMFSFAVFFQLITLPVELNASRRALVILKDTGLLYGDEVSGARKVLTAAAMTYVAAAITSILQLLRLIMLFGGHGRDSD